MSLEVLRVAATCCFWQRRRKEAASAPQTMGGFQVAHRNRGNRCGVPDTSTLLWGGNLRGPSSVLVPEGNTLLDAGEGEAFNDTA